jgi:hypothetical protein
MIVLKFPKVLEGSAATQPVRGWKFHGLGAAGGLFSLVAAQAARPGVLSKVYLG